MKKYIELGQKLNKVERHTVRPYNAQDNAAPLVEWDSEACQYKVKTGVRVTVDKDKSKTKSSLSSSSSPEPLQKKARRE